MDLLLITAVLISGLLLITLGLTVLLYSVPVRSRIRVRIAETGAGSTIITVSWLLFGIRVVQEIWGGSVAVLLADRAVYTFQLSQREETPPVTSGQVPEKKPDRRPPLPGPGRIARIARRLAAPFSTLGSNLWRESRFDGAEGRVTLGFGDPVLTGELYGYYWACRFILEACRIRIEVEPDFNRETFSCDLEASFSLAHPLLVIIAAAKIVVHPALRELASLFTSTTVGGTPA